MPATSTGERMAAEATGLAKLIALLALRLAAPVSGFGRFAQVACKLLLARDAPVSIIKNDVEMIRAAARFGSKVHFGDGARLDLRRASGAEGG